MLGSALLAPPLGAWADQTDRRWVVTLGVSAQVRGAVRGAERAGVWWMEMLDERCRVKEEFDVSSRGGKFLM